MKNPANRIAQSFIVSLMLFGFALTTREKGAAQVVDANAANWSRVKLEHFSFSLPTEMTPLNARGVDSAIWKYSSNTVDLTVDVGIYSERPSDLTTPDCSGERRNIDGKNAIIVFCRNLAADAKSHPFIAAAYFRNVGLKELKLSFFARCASRRDQQVAKRIFLSIRFAKTHRKHKATLHLQRTRQRNRS